LGFKIKTGTAGAPASYNRAVLPTVAIPELSAINTSTDVISVMVTGGRTGEVDSTSGNVVALKLFELPDAAGVSGGVSPMVEVLSGTDLSGETLIVTAIGY